MGEVNELLREHVLRTGFNLTLTKTQIAALTELDAAITRGAWYDRRELSPTWIAFHANFIGGVNGLIRRGLIAHTFRDNEHKYNNAGQQMPISEAYAITEAGKLVIGLLKEAGIYQHYVTAMPAEAVSRG